MGPRHSRVTLHLVIRLWYQPAAIVYGSVMGKANDPVLNRGRSGDPGASRGGCQERAKSAHFARLQLASAGKRILALLASQVEEVLAIRDDVLEGIG